MYDMSMHYDRYETRYHEGTDDPESPDFPRSSEMLVDECIRMDGSYFFSRKGIPDQDDNRYNYKDEWM